MRKLKIILPLIAVILATVAVFAFTSASHNKAPKKDKAEDFVWIKYNCASTPTVQTFPSSPNYQNSTGSLTLTGNFSNCGGNLNICAYRFSLSEVQNIDANNKEPIPGTSLSGRMSSRCR